MNRRTFTATALAAGAGTAVSGSSKAGNQYFEFCFYQLRTSGAEQASRLAAFLRDCHLPTTKRLGIGPVGYFQVYLGPRMPCTITVTAYQSLADLETKRNRLRADKDWIKAVQDLGSPAPAFDRVECWLLRAFDAMPQLEAPPLKPDQPPRFFDLRIYESESFHDTSRKIEMFNEEEIKIFRRCGLNPVLFGETMFGSKIPNLVYMVCYDDWEAREKAWDTFRKDEDWARIRKEPRWAGTVSNITNTFLQPLAFSPIR
jgi:hypothetical protein